MWKVTETRKCLLGTNKGENAVLSTPLYNVSCKIKKQYKFRIMTKIYTSPRKQILVSLM
jgi:hypothetical protein